MRSDELAKKLAQQRDETVAKLNGDPYIGFPSFDNALEECKFTSQPEVLARLLNKENVFISGLAGSGKTTIINRFIELIDAEYDGLFNIAITASTGIAATLIGGSTIHSWSGLGISKEPFNRRDISGFMFSRSDNLKNADVLIIDEISMLPAHLFIKLDKMLKHFRRNKEPFGGVQMVLIGDFLQLPPVVGRDEDDADNRFVIETQEWNDAKFAHCFLDKSYRSNDEKLNKVLVEITKGHVSDESRDMIETRMGASLAEGCVSTTLFTTNKNVDSYNMQELNKNNNEPKIFKRRVVQAMSEKDAENAIKTFAIPEEVPLKVGATVIATKNITYENGESIVNGSLGVIVGMIGDAVLVRLNTGKTLLIERYNYVLTEKVTMGVGIESYSFENELATISQIPLKLGYAITVHKSQGQTFDGVSVDLSKCFQPGLGYVALSRVRSLDDLKITGFSEKAYEVSDKSRAITVHVKKKAIIARRRLLEEKENYDKLLTTSEQRATIWKVEHSASAKNNRR